MTCAIPVIKKLPKEINRTMGENSSNLATLFLSFPADLLACQKGSKCYILRRCFVRQFVTRHLTQCFQTFSIVFNVSVDSLMKSYSGFENLVLCR
jgi:hypothetical protein